MHDLIEAYQAKLRQFSNDVLVYYLDRAPSLLRLQSEASRVSNHLTEPAAIMFKTDYKKWNRFEAEYVFSYLEFSEKTKNEFDSYYTFLFLPFSISLYERNDCLLHPYFEHNTHRFACELSFFGTYSYINGSKNRPQVKRIENDQYFLHSAVNQTVEGYEQFFQNEQILLECKTRRQALEPTSH